MIKPKKLLVVGNITPTELELKELQEEYDNCPYCAAAKAEGKACKNGHPIASDWQLEQWRNKKLAKNS